MPTVHGITINETTEGPSRIETSASAIALVGIAPLLQNTPGSSDALVVCQNAADDATFGKEIDGYTIPQSLRAIRAQSPAAKVMVVNVARAGHYVANPVTTFTDVQIPVSGGAAQLVDVTSNVYPKTPSAVVLTNLAKTVTYVEGTHYSIDALGAITIIDAGAMPDGTDILASWDGHTTYTVTVMVVSLPFAPKPGTLVVKTQNGATTYVEGTDYTVDEWGVVKIILTGSIVEGQVLSFEYERLDASLVVAADIIGAYAPGNATGIQAYDEALQVHNYTPNVIIVPTWNETDTVWQAMEAYADKYKAQSIVDAAAGITPAQAVTTRAATETKNFNTVNPRVLCCYPQLYLGSLNPHAAAGTKFLWGMSSFLAGVMMQNDATRNLAASPSNKALKGFSAVERVITWNASGVGTEAATLNAAGIITLKIFQGVSIWGLTNASYPSVTDGTHFINPRRVYDEMQKATQMATVKFLGEPLNQALIDAVRADINNFLGDQVQAGNIIQGSECTYDPAKNPAANLAAGILSLDVRLVSPSPTGNIIFNYVIDNSLLADFS